MKPLLLSLALAATTTVVSATTFTFVPSDHDLYDLDHRYAYSWGMNLALQPKQTIKSATLTISNIWDWKAEEDRLFVRLLDDPLAGLRRYGDNTADDVIADYFDGKGAKLFEWTDPLGGHARGFDLVYNFSASDLASLAAYVANGHPAGTPTKADFGLTFDPDCHYRNDGVKLQVTVPDGGSTLMLLGGVMCVLGFIRRKA